jgi:hypothetical protein
MEAQAGSECVIMAAMPRRRLAGCITGSKRDFTRDAGNGWRRSQKTSRSGSIPRCLKRTSTFLKKGKCGWRLAKGQNCAWVYSMPLDEIDQLRSVLARAYEKPSPFPLRLVEAVQEYIGTRTPRKPIIESLKISEKKDAA